jgi:cytidylate kinase
MSSIIILSGSPGTGKTTVGRGVAERLSPGIHLVSDVFYRFPARPIDPTIPESHHQNSVVIRAVARAARAFAEGGYHVVLDGIFGPWFFSVLREELSGGIAVSYVVLSASEDVVLARVRGREGTGWSPRVHQMHAAFRDLGELEAHSINTSDLAIEEVVEIVHSGLSGDRFRLYW